MKGNQFEQVDRDRKGKAYDAGSRTKIINKGFTLFPKQTSLEKARKQ